MNRPSQTRALVMWALAIPGGLCALVILLAAVDICRGGAHLSEIVSLADTLGIGVALPTAAGGGTLAMGGRAFAQHWRGGGDTQGAGEP